MTPDRPTEPEFARGWPILVACLIGQMIGVHAIPTFTAGLFVTPLHDALGWSRTAVSAGVMIMTFLTAAMAPVVGHWTTRFDSRRILIVGLAALAVCYVLLSQMTGSVISFWLLLALAAIVGAGSSSVSLSRILVAAFEHRRGAALGIALLGTGLTSVAGPLLVGTVIASHGWRAGYLTLAASIAVGTVAIAVLFLIGEPLQTMTLRTRPHRLIPAQSERLLAAFFLIALATGGAVIHFVPMLEDMGWSVATASRAAAVLGLSLIVGRLLTGILLDHLDPLRFASRLMLIAAFGFGLLCFVRGAGLLLVAPMVGLSLGAELDLMPFIAARLIGGGHFGRVYGAFYAAFLIGAGASTMVYALLERLGGDYRLAFAWSAALLGVSAWLLSPQPKRRTHRFHGRFDQALAVPGKTV